MPSVPQIVAMRSRRRKPSRVRSGYRAGVAASLLSSLLLLTGLLIPALIYADISQGLPSLETLPALLDPPNGRLLQPTVLYDRSGEHVLLTLEHPAAQGHRYLTLPESNPDASQAEDVFSPALISATIAAVDPDFWSHAGFFLSALRTGEHDTIAGRLVASLLLNNEPPGLRTALRERLLAWQVTGHFGREKVLEWYLNSAWYGELVYGADAAARVYFGKSAAGLTLAEAAYLAVIADRPELHGSQQRDAALAQARELLQKMAGQGLIDQEMARKAAGQKLVFHQPEPDEHDPFAAFTSLAVRQLEAQLPGTNYQRGGMKVFTTLDYDLQNEVICTVAVHLSRLNPPQTEGALEPASCQAARLLPTLPVLSSAEDETATLGAEVIVHDVQSGEILALVSQPPSNREPAGRLLAGQTQLPTHDPGSLTTPIVYLTAFTRGMSPGSLVWDIPGELPASDVQIQNFDGRYHGPARLRVALSNDYLVPAALLLEQVGAENAATTAHQLGLGAIQFSLSSPTLSQGNLNILEASRPYLIFANQGFSAGQPAQSGAGLLQPPALLRVTGLDGEVILDWTEPQSQPVLNQELAYLITHVLSDEAARWPSMGHPNPLEIGRPAAVKTGQTARGADTWTVGYTPQRVVTVWVGREAGPGPGQLTGTAEKEASAAETELSERLPVNAAAALWHAIMQYTSRDLPPAGWDAPAGISTVEVCDPSGLLPTASCPSVVSEVFLQGNEPVQRDNLYQELQINRETGRLATLFTPSELIDEQVYMLVPEQAEEWAHTSGIAIPPESYDPIPPQGLSPDVHIDSPEMFAYVGGQVAIQGTAAGEGFDFYRVQVGQGLNPNRWVQIGEDGSQPVQDGILAEWDTEGLDGLYAVQLLVVRQDRSVESAVLQVSVDNQAPSVRPSYPDDGQTIELPSSGYITLLANAEDNLAIGQVEFYVDGRRVETLTQPPFAAPWRARAGDHELRLVAIDRAGNRDEITIEFIVE
ncbi:MAG: penicillin-binding protein [Chloroflexi bacterium]|jgi:membrane peptidoglycan carboxypeptidase|nr:penicillin-binding protein [Chloroflexota bacterium]